MDPVGIARHTIKEYVKKCGGLIEVEILRKDFRDAFKKELPLNGKNITEFLNSISGLQVKQVDEKLFVESVKKPTSSLLPPDFQDLTKLCIRMENNLLLDGSKGKRTVIVKSQAPLKVRKNPVVRNNSSSSCPSEENECEKSFSTGSVHSLHSISSEFLAGSEYLASNLEPSYTSEGLTSLSPTTSSFSIPTVDAYPSTFTIPTPDECGFSGYKTFLPELNAFDPEYNAFTTHPNAFTLESNAFIPEPTFSQDLNALSYLPMSKPALAFEPDFFSYRSTNESRNWSSGGAFLDSYTMLNERIPVSDAEVIERLLKLINFQGHSNGISSFKVEAKYEETYFSKLPNNWLYLLEESSKVFIENLPSGVIIYPNHWYATNPLRTALPPTKYPTKELWSVYISSFESTSCFHFRLLDDEYDLRNDILCHEMNKHYKNMTDTLNTDVRFIGKEELYAVRVKDEWFRCEVIDIADKIATCCLLDVGLTKSFNVTQLFRLNEKFTNTPALAVQGSLTGLEKYDGCNYINCKLRNSILNQKMQLKAVTRGSGNVISARVLIKNSVHCIDVNRAMLDIAEKELSLPKLGVNKVFDVTVLAVEDDHCQVQIMSPCFKLLVESLHKAKRIIEAGNSSHLRVNSMLKLKPNKMYLAKFADDTWQRIIIKQFFAECFVSALFIDFGFIKMVRLGDIVECSDFPDTLTFIPPQAVQIKLLKVDVIILKYLNEMQKTNLFSMKVLNSEELVCQFFFKMPNGERRPVAHLLNNGSNGYSA